jgi:hypothetical protein
MPRIQMAFFFVAGMILGIGVSVEWHGFKEPVSQRFPVESTISEDFEISKALYLRELARYGRTPASGSVPNNRYWRLNLS